MLPQQLTLSCAEPAIPETENPEFPLTQSEQTRGCLKTRGLFQVAGLTYSEFNPAL